MKEKVDFDRIDALHRGKRALHNKDFHWVAPVTFERLNRVLYQPRSSTRLHIPFHGRVLVDSPNRI